MNPFKSYDIRGVYPTDINEEFAYKLGKAIAKFFKQDTIIIGRDCRISSPALTKSMIYGITDMGVNVVDAGLISTPVAGYISNKGNVVMITASHNPAEYNGFKVIGAGVKRIGYELGLNKIQDLMSENLEYGGQKGNVNQENYVEEYATEVLKKFGKVGSHKICIDTANGMGGLVIPKILDKTKIKYDLLYGEPDGTFPNHPGNPLLEKNTEELQHKIKKGDYDLGAAYDTDCDRIVFIDEKGNKIKSDYILALIFDHTDGCAVRTVSVSRIIDEIGRKNGKNVYESKVGYVNVQKTMKEHECEIGGEISGHFYFKEFYYIDSGDLALMRVLEIMNKTGRKISELIEKYKTRSKSEEVNIEVEDTEKSMDAIEKGLRGTVERIDGITITNELQGKQYWVNIRKSNTEPLIRINAEADDEKTLKNIMDKTIKLAKHL